MQTPDSLYIGWMNCVDKITNGEITDWKRDSPEVHGMLEHVQYQDAVIYLQKCIEFSYLTQKEIVDYCKMCDSIGNPVKHRFQFSLDASTTCIRYLFHALTIITNPANDLDNNHIVEIGGGYGGLALAMDYVYKCTRRVAVLPTYTIVDLPEINNLQRWYLKQFKLDLNVTYEYDYTDPRKCFVVSNYCLAEIGEENRQTYINNLILPHAYAGFFAWNSNASLNFLLDNDKFNTKIETEVPQTGPDNKIVTFIRKPDHSTSQAKFSLRDLS
jgi:hypothetical protein